MKIENGKFYKTRDGRKVGPAFVKGFITTFGSEDNHSSAVWTNNGRKSPRNDETTMCLNDIVSEWHEGPVQTVTRKEIVPGEYGKIAIISSNEKYVRLSLIYSGFAAVDLREAAQLFNTVADALEYNAKEQNDD